jgi:hypothetical protein
MLASLLAGVCECTLRKPIPLERDLQTESSTDVARLLDAGEVVIEAVPTKIMMAEQESVSLKEAEEAAAQSPAFGSHPFPTCFTCGPQRKEGEGLRIFPGRIATDSHAPALFAAPWLPDPSLTSGGAIVRPEFVWAAMDCPTGFAAGFPWLGTLVTGRLAVQQLLPVYPLRPYVVMSWSMGNEGRKYYAGGSLYGPDGELCAKARATWVKVA